MEQVKKMGNALLDVRTLISSILAAIISSGTAVLARLNDLADGQTIGNVSSTFWIILGIGTLITILKDVNASIKEPPK